jgi:hypothetical protein
MAQPPAYTRTHSFSDWTANYPTLPHSGVRLDAEYDNLALTLAAVRTNLALIQRDDGEIANETIGADQLNPEITIGLRSVTSWATATAYVVNDAVWTTGKLYRCLVAHTSASAFSTDLTAVKWVLVFDPTDMVQEAVNEAIADGLINVNVDTSNFAGLSSANAFTSTNSFAAATTFTALPTVQIATAVTAADYVAAKPSDYGAGKPGFFVRKKATANAWEIEIDDGAAGSGALDIVVSAFAALTVNGVTLAPATDIATLTTSVRRARNLALTS